MEWLSRLTIGVLVLCFCSSSLWSWEFWRLGGIPRWDAVHFECDPLGRLFLIYHDSASGALGLAFHDSAWHLSSLEIPSAAGFDFRFGPKGKAGMVTAGTNPTYYEYRNWHWVETKSFGGETHGNSYLAYDTSGNPVVGIYRSGYPDYADIFEQRDTSWDLIGRWQARGGNVFTTGFWGISFDTRNWLYGLWGDVIAWSGPPDYSLYMPIRTDSGWETVTLVDMTRDATTGKCLAPYASSGMMALWNSGDNFCCRGQILGRVASEASLCYDRWDTPHLVYRPLFGGLEYAAYWDFESIPANSRHGAVDLTLGRDGRVLIAFWDDDSGASVAWRDNPGVEESSETAPEAGPVVGLPPCNGLVRIPLRPGRAPATQVDVFGVSGRRVESVRVSPGAASCEIDVRRLPKGAYLLLPRDSSRLRYRLIVY